MEELKEMIYVPQMIGLTDEEEEESRRRAKAISIDNAVKRYDQYSKKLSGIIGELKAGKIAESAIRELTLLQWSINDISFYIRSDLLDIEQK